MMRNILFRNKTYVFVGVCVTLVFLCWQLAFKKTFTAISLNRELKAKSLNNSALVFNPGYLSKKSEALSRLSKYYTADSAVWKDGFWLKTSRVALSQGVNIEYNPAKLKLQSDSVGRIISQQVKFEGAFKNLVKLTDTLERMDGLGYVRSLRFFTTRKRGIEENKKLFLEVGVAIIK